MPRSAKPARGASGGGSIRKKTITRNGKTYSYWEGRYTVGYDPKTGKQRQKSITGKSKKAVAELLGHGRDDVTKIYLASRSAGQEGGAR